MYIKAYSWQPKTSMLSYCCCLHIHRLGLISYLGHRGNYWITFLCYGAQLGCCSPQLSQTKWIVYTQTEPVLCSQSPRTGCATSIYHGLRINSTRFLSVLQVLKVQTADRTDMGRDHRREAVASSWRRQSEGKLWRGTGMVSSAPVTGMECFQDHVQCNVYIQLFCCL